VRVAAIDCGTNSIRLLVADVDADGRLVDRHREMRIVRLGQDVDRTGRLAPEAIERARVVLADYRSVIDRFSADGLRVERVRMVATSATRDAANRDDFTTMVTATLGVEPEVISGVAEAALSYAGAASVLDAVDGPVLVADIGGGSSELVLGDVASGASGASGGADGLRSHSMDIGSVRMTERHLHTDPPSPAQVAAARADIVAAISAARADVPLDEAVRLIGVAGTVTTVAAMALGLTRYDSAALHGAEVTTKQTREVTGRLLAMPYAERAAIPAIHPGRVDVIAGGALILLTLLEEIGAAGFTASEHDILDGIALSLR
jgi:exopolyphosphatase/guanosine-5'-triphosphate,3'-diphosphate pyrophosphatase